MIHLTEEDLILHYYGEQGETLAAEQHLDGCEECRAHFAALQRVLNVVDSLPAPVRGPEYGSEVWKRIESRLPARRRFRLLQWRWHWAAAAAAFAVLLVAAFLAGRGSTLRPRHSEMAAADPRASERVLMAALGDYLERSQMMLVELANANPAGKLDISAEQETAADLISESRLYRQTAVHEGEDSLAAVLDEIESVLLEITHSPSALPADRLEELRRRLRAEGILFKIRVLGWNVRDREAAAPSTAGHKL
jgi:hypothetical protein